MILSTIYKKPVDRPIEGVIKADDDASLLLELEEYVLTNEIEKRLENFLSEYNNYKNSNGVWISGFFGSGKSHLLKMLALVLRNKAIEGKNTLELFQEKCGDNQLLRADLKKAVSFPSQSILFNIDQKADVISKDQSDALLAVFAKVFDEECGYYGKHGYIAEFERDLDSRDLYQIFKEKYQSIAGKPWETGREQVLFETQNIAKAYEQTTGNPTSSTDDILDKYRDQYTLSIEDFADRVKAYIDKQPKSFRLNFFVDEVGQYIADNIKLMTNLQTVAESLATKCRGQAWIIVTAQEDMSGVVGEMTKQQGNDFTKIQARFANRLKLTSQDVAEVIQKRLLSKKNEAESFLSKIYKKEFNNFKTLFDFSDGSVTYQNFKDEKHFLQSYPFIPYQFSLFQSSIQNLSQHNAFEGRHSSVGERSMLGVFQQVAIKINNAELGQLATFDLMFEGIRSTLKSQIQKAVIQAENHLGNPFALRLLKALFLVKYVKEFKATKRNLVILMIDSFEVNLPELTKKIEEALNLLEQQTYIQRSADTYEYLTDEEKDVEQEIKNTDVETAAVAEELEKIIFGEAIKSRKIIIKENKQDYSYSRKLDDKLYGREYELAINIITPFHEKAGIFSAFQGLSMAHDEVIVIMPTNDRLVPDILMYKRTQKYIGQNIRTTQQDSIKRILTEKSVQNGERLKEIQNQIKQLLSTTQILVQGKEIEIGTRDPESRIIKGFEELVGRVYPNLVMLRGISYSENNIPIILNDAQHSLLETDVEAQSEPEQEIFSHIQSNKRGGVRTTLKSLIEKFEKKPYGWPYAAILCNLATLCARGKIEVRANSNILEDSELERALTNTREQGNIVLEPQLDFTAAQVRTLKTFYADFFDKPVKATEAKSLGKETVSAFQDLLNDLNPLISQATQFPFLNNLVPAKQTVEEVTGKPYTWYLTELAQQSEDLLDLKEDVLDPIRKFMSGSQKDIYLNARELLQQQASNFSYINDNEASQIQVFLDDPNCFKGNKILQIKSLTETLQSQIKTQLDQEIKEATSRFITMQEKIKSMDEFNKLTKEQQTQLTSPFEQQISNIENEKLIAVIRETLRRFEENEYQRLLAKMVDMANPPPQPETTATKDQVADDSKPPTEYILNKKININFSKAWIASEEDLEQYINKLREAYLKEIRAGKRINI